MPPSALDIPQHDSWIAVGDSENEWLTFRRGWNNRICKTHTQVGGSKPNWGTSNFTGTSGDMYRAGLCCSVGDASESMCTSNDNNSPTSVISELTGHETRLSNLETALAVNFNLTTKLETQLNITVTENMALRNQLELIKNRTLPAKVKLTEKQEILRSGDNIHAYDNYGWSVSMHGDTALVGAARSQNGDSSSYYSRGSAYFFVRSGATWSQQSKFQGSQNYGYYGWSVSLRGNYAFIGARNDDGGCRNCFGAVYVFKRSGSSWTQTQKLSLSSKSGDFGRTVCVSDKYAFITARHEPAGTLEVSSSVFVFELSGSTWTQKQQIRDASNRNEGDRSFGNSISLNSEYAFIGAPGGDGYHPLNNAHGKVYVYKRSTSSSNWVEHQILEPFEIGFGTKSALFGYSVNLNGDYAIVGSPWEREREDIFWGFVYIYKHNGTNWNQVARFCAEDAWLDGGRDEGFGYSVSLDGDTAIIGAYKDGAGAGAAYFYARSGASWTFQKKLLSSNGNFDDIFGHSVAIFNKTVLIGAPQHQHGKYERTGSAYIFDLDIYSYLGEGECRMANGQYPISFNVHDSGSLTWCKDLCLQYTWCLAVQKQGNGCRLITDTAAFITTGGNTFTDDNDKWGATRTFDDKSYTTYCGGSGQAGVCRSVSYEFSGGLLNSRSGYHCYVKK